MLRDLGGWLQYAHKQRTGLMRTGGGSGWLMVLALAEHDSSF